MSQQIWQPGEPMNRKRIVVLITALCLAGALFYFCGGHHTPPGQPPLADLTTQNFGSIGIAFNGAKDDVRVLLLLSPT